MENPYIARTKMKKLLKYLPVSLNHIKEVPDEARWDSKLEYTPVLTLDKDMHKAFLKMNELERIEASLPGLDCGSCGAPSCRALAEDVVRGLASEEDCIFRFRENVSSILTNIKKIEGYIPAAVRHRRKQRRMPDGRNLK